MKSKNIIILNCYVNNKEKKNILYDYIKQLKKTNNDILLISHNSVDSDILNLVDYFIYDKENFLLPLGMSPVTWFADANEYINIYSCRHGYAIIKNIYSAINFLYDIGTYEKFFFTEYDNSMTDEDVDKINKMFNQLDEFKKELFIFYLSNQKFNFGNVLHQTAIFAGNIKFFKENIPLVKSFDEWTKTPPFANNSEILESIFVHMVSHVKDKILYYDGEAKEYFNNSKIDIFQIFDHKYSIVYNKEDVSNPLIFLYSYMGHKYEVIIDNQTVINQVIPRHNIVKHYFKLTEKDTNVIIKINDEERVNTVLNINNIENYKHLADRGSIPKPK